MLIRFLNYVAILSFGLLAACVPLMQKQAVAVRLPIAAVTWQSVAEYCAIPTLPTPVILESVNRLLPEACDQRPTISETNNAVQLFCANNEPCHTLVARDALQLPALNATANLTYSALHKMQQSLETFDQQYSVLHVAEFGAIDRLIKHGLQSFERTGLNPYKKAVIATINSRFHTGVWPRDNNIITALQTGQSYVTTQTATSLSFAAVFGDVSCNEAVVTTNVLDTAPENARQLHFISVVDGANNTSDRYIVKHWLDLAGQLHRKKIKVDLHASCSVVHDRHFDSAHASAYFLVLKNIAATTPIWYLPPRG